MSNATDKSSINVKEFGDILADICFKATKHFDVSMEALRVRTREIELRANQLDEREASLSVRESTVKNREAAVAQVSEIASQRKAKIATLEKNQAGLVAKANEALAAQKKAEVELERLEGVVRKLLKDKQELKQRVKYLESCATGELHEVPAAEPCSATSQDDGGAADPVVAPTVQEIADSIPA